MFCDRSDLYRIFWGIAENSEGKIWYIEKLKKKKFIKTRIQLVGSGQFPLHRDNNSCNLCNYIEHKYIGCEGRVISNELSYRNTYLFTYLPTHTYVPTMELPLIVHLYIIYLCLMFVVFIQYVFYVHSIYNIVPSNQPLGTDLTVFI